MLNEADQGQHECQREDNDPPFQSCSSDVPPRAERTHNPLSTRNENLSRTREPIQSGSHNVLPTTHPYPESGTNSSLLMSSRENCLPGISNNPAARPPRPPQSQEPRQKSESLSGGNSRDQRSLDVFRRTLDQSRKQLPRHLGIYMKVDRQFQAVNEYDEQNRLVYFKCLNCGEPIYNKKMSCGKMFHLINCPGLPKPTRDSFHDGCNDKNKPPALTNPFPGITVAMAKRIHRESGESSSSQLSQEQPIIPRFGRYMIAQKMVKPSTKIVECSRKEHTVASDLLIELIIDENLPFSICDNVGQHPRPLARLLGYLRPGYKLPLGYKVGGELLDRFYKETMKDMKRRLRSMLHDCRATLMFDGSEDVNGAPMINVLLRIMGTSRVDTVTFFLTSVYTGYDTVDANYYVRMSEKVIRELVGFEHVAGIVTDNTGSVKNARESLEKRYARVVASQDQAHVADRLLSDIGGIQWVATTLQTLSMISTDIRRFRKLRARLVELMTEYNFWLIHERRAQTIGQDSTSKTRHEAVEDSDKRANSGTDCREQDVTAVHCSGAVAGNNRNWARNGIENGGVAAVDRSGFGEGTSDEPEQIRRADSAVRNNSEEQRECRKQQGLARNDEVSSFSFDLEGDDALSGVVFANLRCLERKQADETKDLSSDSEEEDVEDPSIKLRSDECRKWNPSFTNAGTQKKARIMKKVSNVRFASCEKLLDEFLSLRPVLLTLVQDPLFDRLYTAKSEEKKTERKNSFVKPIQDENLLLRVRQLHAIFHACRTYLRIFDSETAMVSEVFEATKILEETLQKLPLAFFPQPKEACRKELLDVFRNRKEGPLPGFKRIKIRLLSDLHIAAALLDPYRTPFRAQDYMDAFRRHLDKYLSGVTCEELGIQEGDRNEFMEEIIAKYAEVRGIWRRKGMLREHSEGSMTNEDARPSSRSRRMRSPAAWWVSGSITKPQDLFERRAVEELIEFARRTLSVSPTATATERTFSLEGRIHGKTRASLGPKKVRKILFCQWNSRVLRYLCLRDEQDEVYEMERQTLNISKLRSFRAAAERASDEEISMHSSFEQDSADSNALFHATQGRRKRQCEHDSQQHSTPFQKPDSADGQAWKVRVTESLPVGVAKQMKGDGSQTLQNTLQQNLGAVISQQLPPLPSSMFAENYQGWVQMIHTTVAAYPPRVPSPSQLNPQGVNPRAPEKPGHEQLGSSAEEPGP